MNIGFFSDSYNPGYSGVETSIDSFKDELEKQGHTVYIFAPKVEGEHNHKEEQEKGIFRFVSLDQVFFPEFKITFPIPSKITKDFGSFDLDVIHSHTPFYMGFYANIVASTLNIPIVHTYHTFYEKYTGHSFIKHETTDKFMMQLIAKISKLHPDRCNLTIAPSEKMKRVLKEYGISGDIAVLPTGIDIEPITKTQYGEFRKKHGIADSTRILTTVSRVAPEKNIDFIVDAFSEIAAKQDDVTLVIAGDGPAREDLEAKSKVLGIEERVLFVGHLPRAEVFELLTDADIFLFASKTDTQSLALMEAAAASLPIIMVEDPNLTEVIEHNINAFEVGENTTQFAERINKLLDDTALRGKMADASRKISEQYTAEKQTVKLLGLYSDMITDHVKHSLRGKLKKQLNKEVNYRELLKVDKNKAFFQNFAKRTKQFINRIKE